MDQNRWLAGGCDEKGSTVGSVRYVAQTLRVRLPLKASHRASGAFTLQQNTK